MDFKVNFGDEYDELLRSIVAEATEELGIDDKLDEEFNKLDAHLDENVMCKLAGAQELFDKLSDDVTKLEIESEQLQKELNKQRANEVITVEDDTSPVSSDVNEPIKKKNKNETQKEFLSSRQPKPQGERQYLRKFRPTSKLLAMHLYVDLEVLALCKDEWKKAVIIDQQKHKDKIKYKVRFTTNTKSLLQISHLATIDNTDKFELSEVNVGMRVAAWYRNEGIYSGVIAEACDKKMNNNRLLVFFDDGYAAYCPPKYVYLVYGLRRDVWNDITCKGMGSYIKTYLSTEVRQLLSIREGQTLKVEFEGVWHVAKCLKVDGSLAEILYLSDNSKELIYRGSMRLEPLYRKHHPPKTKNVRQGGGNRIARAHTGMRKAHIEYTTIDLTRDSSPPEEAPKSPQPRKLSYESSQEKSAQQLKKEGQWQAPWEKTLSAQQQIPKHVTQIPKSYSEMQGGVNIASHLLNRFAQKELEEAALKSEDGKPRGRSQESKRIDGGRRNSANASSSSSGESPPHLIPHTSSPFTPHKCSQRCIAPFQLRRNLKGVNPLLKPLLLSWTRELSRVPSVHRSTFHVHYRGPCGRGCRNMRDVQRYMTECGIHNLDFTNFSFDAAIRVQENTEIRTRDAKIFIKDYSHGKEDIPVSCVNEINTDEPPKMPYTKTRVPGRGVKINTNTDFMVCCDCPDNCSDRANCPCQQLTVQATSCCRGSKMKPDAGYRFKRLYSFLPTGIYECNSRCKCKTQCHNRVVQLGLQCRLQMFKTQKKGWGIRCLDDIAQGTFVCIYTGKIQTEGNANDEGLINGDEYLAELDHIEVAENQKLDYNENDSSGIDSLSDDVSTDDESNGGKKQKITPGHDSTDTEGEAPECVKMTFRRQSGTTWSISSEGNENQVFKEKPTKQLSAGSKKLGYSSDPEVNPGIIPDAVRRRRGRNMVARSNLPSNDSSIDSEPGEMVFEPKRVNLIDEDTTDTDSDTNGTNSRRQSSVAVKYTSALDKQMDKLAMGDMDSSSDEEDAINKTRRLFGTEGTFIIDAKQTGNLGRYLNHSCTPNLMVQNVFIDTHDLRFPWVAFFASCTIRAGTELTWDYNYEIGAVHDRVIHCYCGSTKCRKRLL